MPLCCKQMRKAKIPYMWYVNATKIGKACKHWCSVFPNMIANAASGSIHGPVGANANAIEELSNPVTNWKQKKEIPHSHSRTVFHIGGILA